MSQRKHPPIFHPSLDMYVEAPVVPRYVSDKERLQREHQAKTAESMQKYLRGLLTPRRRPR